MQVKPGLSQLDKKVLGVLLIALLVLISTVTLSYFIFSQPNQTQNTPLPTPTPTPTSEPTPTPSPTLPTASVTAVLNVTQNSYGYLLINGTVTNNSPNTAYDVGLESFASASILMMGEQDVINMTVPIASGEYAMGTDYTLSTLAPYETVSIDITILPYLQSQTPTLKNVKVTLVWSNTP